jgi:hypothetical protein
MSTKTTFKRIALVAVAALGFGVLSVVPSQADVTGLIVTTTNGTGATVLKTGESTTAATIKVQYLGLATSDTVTVSIVAASAHPATASLGGAGLWFTESTTSTSTAPKVDTATSLTAAQATGPIAVQALITPGSFFRVTNSTPANGTYSVTMKYSLGETTTSTVPAGTYSFNAVVTSVQGAVTTNTVHPFTITIAAAPVAAAAVPAAGSAKAFIQASTTYPSGTVLSDSATSGSLVAGTHIGTLRVSNFSSTDVAAKDTMTVVMTGVGSLTTTGLATNITGRSFIVANLESLTANVIADGTSGTGTITITTAAGASFVKTVTFFDTKVAKATATVSKAFIKAGATTAGVFSVVVADSSGNAVTNATVTAAATDTTTTVGGAVTCAAYSASKAAYICDVAGLSATKFGAVAYTITATGADAAATKVTTTASITFSDSVATKAVLAGATTGAPGASVDYTLTLTEKNGYAVADQTYGAGSTGGVLFASAVVSGWTTAPFATTESFTSVSGVITSKGILPFAGTATGTWTLVGDGLQTLAANAIDKTIGKTTITATTDVANPGVDAATDAANEATDAANAATDAALAAAEAADAATTAAQEASDAVAALSETVTKLISDLQAQIKSLAAVVAKIAKKVKA